MKRVINVLCILILTIFVSGYKYDLEVSVKEDKRVKILEEMEFNQSELNSLVCFTPDACDLNEDNVKSGVTSFYTKKNKNTTKVDGKFEIKYNQETSSAKYTATYLFNDIDDIVGSINDTFNLYNMDFSHKIFTINGRNYSFNTKYKSDVNAASKLTLILPVRGEQSNADEKSEDGKTLTWNLKDNKKLEVKFELASNVELVGGDQYNRIENNKFITIGIGVVAGIVALIVLLNIFKRLKKTPVQQNDVENQKFDVNSVFNSNANITTPVSLANQEQSIQLEKNENHHDVISNKFLDDSFAEDITSVDESNVSSPVSSPVVDEQVQELIDVHQTEETTEIEEQSTPTVVDNNPDMSSVAFGGTPIEDKNINEIN